MGPRKLNLKKNEIKDDEGTFVYRLNCSARKRVLDFKIRLYMKLDYIYK